MRKNNSVDMGAYYANDEFGLVRTISKAIDYHTNEIYINYVVVQDGGIASNIYIMPLREFEDKFLIKER